MPNSLSNVLFSNGPSSGLKHANLFGQFVGSWDLEVVWYENTKPVRRARGEWHFGWILSGRAIQDVWMVPTLAEQTDSEPPYEYGSSLRFPDESGEFWHSTWHGPVRKLVAYFHARQVGDEIVLERQGDGDHRARWVFFDIRSDHFRWRNEEFASAGDSATVVQDFRVRRRS